MKLALCFTHPKRELSPNGQLPLTAKGAMVANRKKVALKGATRNAAYLQTLSQMSREGLSTFPARSVSVEWRYKGRIPDVDNVVARLKPLLDGCCHAFGIDDRYLELGWVRRVHTKENAGTVILHFNTEEPTWTI